MKHDVLRLYVNCEHLRGPYFGLFCHQKFFLLPEIWSWRPLKSQTGQVNRSVGKQVENSHQTSYSIELACKHHTLKHKHTTQVRMLVLLTNILQHTTETLLTCARPQVYSTATHGFPELVVMAAGANGKPVSKAEASKWTTPRTKQRLA